MKASGDPTPPEFPSEAGTRAPSARAGSLAMKLLTSLFALAFLAVAPFVAAQSPSSQDKEEDVERVDPYTRGNEAALAKLGYVQFGPFVFFDEVRTESVEEALGGVHVLWVETAHFKIGVCLRTYRQDGDPAEDKKLEEE